MTITRVLQPHVCCVGNPVAGNPTQFVMYRAAQAAGVDWRFFTSQVSTDLFETAFRGIQALGLDGVAVFDPFQSAAIPLLDSVTESALALGKVNVARSDRNSWLGDNTLGAAISKLVQSRSPAPSSSTSQDAPSAPSDAVAESKSFIAVIDSPATAKTIQLANPVDKSRVLSLCTETQNVSIDSPSESIANQPLGSTSGVEPGNDVYQPVDLIVDSRQPIQFLILETAPTQLQLRKLSSLTWASNAKCMMVHPSAERPNRLLSGFLAETSLELFEPVELMAYQAAADFHFWTGVEPSVDLIRDSLEEYLQW